MKKSTWICILFLLYPLMTFANREDLPEIGVIETVYLGDKMLKQRYGFYDTCKTVTQDLIFARKRYERVCLISSQTFEKSYSRGVSQITEGGILCPLPMSSDKKNKYAYTGINFFGYRSKDGSDQRPARPWSLRENKSNKRWYAEPNGSKVVDLPSTEFDRIFEQHLMFNIEMFAVRSETKQCDIRVSNISGQYAVFRNVSEVPQNINDGVSFPFQISNIVNTNNGVVFSGSYMSEIYSLWKGGERAKGSYRGYPINGYINPDDLDDSFISDNAYLLYPNINSDYETLIETTHPYIIEDDKLQRYIEYAGKSGDILNFIYSEFYGNMARVAFTREFSIDSSEGNIGAYKGAIFEIIKATNSDITYKVIRHFPE